MDDRRFDALARALVTGTSRRRVLGALAGAPLWALTLTRRGPEEAAAACVKLGKKCGQGDKCCNGNRCRQGKCACKPGRDRCRRVCCRKGDVCAGGKCVTGRGTRTADDDFCAGTPVGCSGDVDCFCIKDLAGETRCVRPAPDSIACGDCETDAACEPLADRAFCAGTACCGAPVGLCVVPCSEAPPPPPAD